MRLAPAQVRVRSACLVERHELVPGAAGIMRDYRVVGIDIPHELLHHPVWVDGHLVRVQLVRPLVEPRLAHRCDLLGCLAVSRLAAKPVSARLDHLPDDELGVTEQRELNVVVLADVDRVVRRLDEGFVTGDVCRHPVPGQAGSDREHYVCTPHEAVGCAVHYTGTRPKRQRMLLREAALPRHTGRHGNLQQLGQLDKVV